MLTVEMGGAVMWFSSNLQHNGRRLGSAFFARSLISSLIVLLFAISLPSCASLSTKFRGATKADIGFFADETITILSQSDFAFTRNETVYTREFFNPDGVEEQQLQALVNQVEVLFQKILDYSLGLVVIYQTKRTDAERVEAYTDSLETADDRFLEAIKLPRDTFEELIVEIRNQKKFIDALQAAQPILNGVGWYMNTVLNDMVEATDKLALRVEKQIDKRYAEIIWYQEALEQEKNTILDALKLVYKTFRGDKGAYDRLRTSGAIQQQGLLPKSPPSQEELAAIAKHLMTRLEGLHKISQQVDPMWNLYRAAHTELDQLYDKMIKSVNQARMLIIVWVSAHYQMASGKKAPAEWFDIGTVPNLATSAVF